jgi:hypothetical protein
MKDILVFSSLPLLPMCRCSWDIDSQLSIPELNWQMYLINPGNGK